MHSTELKQLLADAAGLAPGQDLIVVGSQSILGWYDDASLPEATTFSREADVYVDSDPDETITTLLDANLGELTEYDSEHGVYLQGIDANTARLPADWRDRSRSWALPGGGQAHFPEPHDLAVSKLAADRTKDREYVASLIEAGLVDVNTLIERLQNLDVEPTIRRRVERFLAYRR